MCLSSPYSFLSRVLLHWLTQRPHRKRAAHIRSYQTFCELRTLQSFAISVKYISFYIAYLVTQKGAYGTILNHLSGLKHAHQFAGYELTYSSDTFVTRCYTLFRPGHFLAMWALFLVTFSRKSNLVPDNTRQMSPLVITRAYLVFSSSGANIHVSTTKTIQCQQRSLVLPIPSLPRSRLCPICALCHHLSLNSGLSSVPLFTVLMRSG